MNPRATDLAGMRFGRLIVLARAGSDAHGQAMWSCRCDCGGTAVVRGMHLRTGNTLSCGCLYDERGEGRTETLLTALTPEQKESVRRHAELHGLSLSEVVRRALIAAGVIKEMVN